MNDDLVITVKDLKKSYGGKLAVKGVDLKIRRGEIFALLGPNGAGKTTVIEILEGHRNKTSGDVTVLGHDPEENSSFLQNRLGIMLQDNGVEPYLKVEEILEQCTGFYENPKTVEEILLTTGLLEQRNSYPRQLSGGQQRRLDFAICLCGDPDLLFLDEPTTGLDPQARRNIWGLIREIHQRGVTVVLTTHYMEEAEELCDRLAIMDGGSLKAVDTPRNLVGRLQAAYTVKLAMDNPLTEDQMASLNGSVEFVQELDGNSYLLRLKSGPSSLGKVLDEMVRSDINLERLEIAPVTLEDVFLELTGNELRD